MLHQVHEGVTFDIELAAGPVFEKFGECRNIIVSDMSLVRTRMDRQTGSAGFQSHGTEKRNRRRIAVTGIANQRNLIEIDGKFGQHKKLQPS